MKRRKLNLALVSANQKTATPKKNVVRFKFAINANFLLYLFLVSLVYPQRKDLQQTSYGTLCVLVLLFLINENSTFWTRN